MPIPGSEDQQELVLNDVVQVSIEAAEGELSRAVTDWRFGYAMTVLSTQGLTVKNPQKVWIIDDYMQWSNLAYLAVSRVEYMSQLTRVVQPSEGDKAPASERQLTDQQLPFLRNMIAKKLVGDKRQDEAKGRKFDLKVKDVLALARVQGDTVTGDGSNRCVACNIQLLWSYAPKDTQQGTLDRIDNTRGHLKNNVRLTCLECNRSRGAAAVAREERDSK